MTICRCGATFAPHQRCRQKLRSVDHHDDFDDFDDHHDDFDDQDGHDHCCDFGDQVDHGHHGVYDHHDQFGHKYNRWS